MERSCYKLPAGCVVRAIARLAENKAGAEDGLQAEMLHCLSGFGADVLQDIFETKLRGQADEQGTPPDWRSTLVVLLAKKKKPQTGKDFRGIALLNCLRKVWSYAILELLEVHDQRTDASFGCRRGWQRAEAVAFARTVAGRAASLNRPLYKASCDVSAAHDRVSRCEIEKSLRRRLLPEAITQAIMHTLTESTCICARWVKRLAP